jgi:probable HAF family extracellular repeat protein
MSPFVRCGLRLAVVLALASGARAWAGYTFQTIDPPGSTHEKVAYGINNAGQIVGGYNDNSGNHGFLYSGGAFTKIDVPGAGFTRARGINNAGQIVGDTGDGGHGFLYSGGAFTTINPPGASTSFAYGINDAGQIVGFYQTVPGGTEHGFLYSGGVFTTIDVPGAVVFTEAHGINDAGQIVGDYVGSGRVVHGFLSS